MRITEQVSKERGLPRLTWAIDNHGRKILKRFQQFRLNCAVKVGHFCLFLLTAPAKNGNTMTFVNGLCKS